MNTRKSRRRYLLHLLLILCCLSFYLSGCPSNEITVSGEITSEKCESGNITILVNDCNLNPIVEKKLDGCGAYSILIHPTYIGKQVVVAVHCDEDNDGEFSIGDRGGGGEWVELQLTNEVNIDVYQEFTATIEGEISCEPYTDGLLYIFAFDGSLNKGTPPSYIGGPLLPVNLNEKNTYKVILSNTSLGNEVLLFGFWDKDKSGLCHDKSVNQCDYDGFATSFVMDNEEMTGINFDACQVLVEPCFESVPEEAPQDDYAIDNLPGSDISPHEFDEEILAELVDCIEAGDFGNIHSLIIIHNDSLALEEYFMGWTRHMFHYCYSVTKSVTSALIGIALDQGKINGLDEKLLSFFPEYDDIENLDERKESITLENVLTMSSGFVWNGDISTGIMMQSRDWVKYVLDCPMSSDPGTKFVYNNGGTHLLSGIITNQTGQSAEEFAEENLFSKMGITKWEWKTDPNGLSNTEGIYGGLYLHPVNMAMFGYLYLKNGFLNGEQIVPEDWVKESTIKQIDFYGYQWWVLLDLLVKEYPEAEGTYYALGAGGTQILIIPNFNMIVVITAENFEDHQGSGFDILFDYILPALKEK